MSRALHPRAHRRAWQDKTGELNNRRFRRAINWFSKREKEESNVVVWTGTDWELAGGRGLIHKGRKPRG